MHHLWKKLAAVGFLTFLALWVAGTLGGMTVMQPAPSPAGSRWSAAESSSHLPSANNLAQVGLAKTPLPVVLDQLDVERIRVHEKNAQLAMTTVDFDSDEALIRSALAVHQATVFNEQKGGIAPDRKLTIEIGVHPDKFDALVERLRGIAQLESIEVQQRDRTGDFRRLHAQRQSLKKYLESMLKLRDVKNPSIDDTLKLEQKIQDIEKELQKQNVQLGDLLGKESFYHVYVTLSEYQPGSKYDRTSGWATRLGHSFYWAMAWWFAVVAAIGVAAATVFSIRTLWPKWT
jgi:hypothetical protein